MAKLDWSGGMVELKCPHCGKIVSTRAANQYRYGSPLKNCRFCKENYIDPFFHELAAEPPAPNAFSVKHKLIGMVIFAVIFVLCFAFHWFEVTYEDGYHPMFAWLMVLTALGEIGFVIEIVLIKTGFKERRTERLRRESEERLKNPVYARELARLGYPVPREYLGEEAEREENKEIPDFLF